MTLEDNTLNAKELWELFVIREETEDEYGRMGRGIPLIYFNAKYEKNKFFQYENVKEAVLEFETVLKKAIEDNCLNIKTEDTLDVFKDIFGDFEK